MISKKEFFGQYGKLVKIVINTTKEYDPDSKRGPSYSAFITYSLDQEAALAILSVDGLFLEGRVIRASFGSNKYCLHFLKNVNCVSKECMFVHNFAQNKDLLNKVKLINYQAK